MILFYFALLSPFMFSIAIAVGGVVLCKAFPRFSACWTLVGLHTLLVLLLIAPSFVGKGGGERPFDDLYMPFYLYPGMLVYYIEGKIAHLAWPWLNEHVGYHEGSYICIVLIPAILTAVAGAAFWFIIGALVGSEPDSIETGE